MTRTYHPVRGDVVRVGKGKKLWIVDRLWSDAPGCRITTGNDPKARSASLVPVDGYSGTSCEVDRLTLVTKASDRREAQP